MSSKNIRTILLPYISRNGHNIHSKIVGGGIEKFTKNIYEVFPKAIPVEITSEDRRAKKTKQIYLEAVNKYNPDLIIVNDIDSYWLYPQIELGIPTIAIAHEPLTGDIRYLTWWRGMQKFIDAGGHLYFVSEYQQNFHARNVERITGAPLQGIKGIINSGFANGTEQVKKNSSYDAVTIGRTDTTKNPFLLHKKLSGTGLSSCVITNAENFQQNKAQQKYWDDNLYWKNPQHTYRGLNHQNTLDVMATAQCYVSTTPIESWGITCMEALLHGLPVILLCNQSGRHASETIPAESWHYKILKKSCSQKELTDAIEEFRSYTYKDRLKISEETKKKHSKEKWVSAWDAMLQKL